MKRIIWFLTLLLFLVASNMQLIHASEMKNESINKEHAMHNEDDSIFCDVSEDGEKQENDDCYQDIIWDRYISSNQLKLESVNAFNLVSFSSFQYDEPIVEINLNSRPHSPPDIFFQKSSYSNLLWIIKNLN
ncbi:MAG: hypothetical protein ACD_3C00231G0004 [uncultured bacterium (gcode 4)]|uniref:Uncharacterized protein n=1 Tax=uncultured bacterium (gcode 4) TaxID=1234023 RepID=K2F7X7_9BACT|nr:MAG: hypothetical protein ACD_3C00231G0004 [uncultured bacterium (gcode 4)]